MTRYWYDSEFIDTGSTIDLISIGIVSSDGRELYLQSCEFTLDKASPWVREHVIHPLDPCPRIVTQPGYSLGTIYGAQAQHKQGQCAYADCPWRTREQIKQEILAFMDVEKYGKPEIWTYYGCYDHVVFCQLFGTMMDLPKGFPMYTRDIKMWCNLLGDPRLPEQGKGEHNALLDARWNKQAWEFLNELASSRALCSPLLTQFMDNLYQAGMSIENVVEHGFDYACQQAHETAYAALQTSNVVATISDTAVQFDASKAVLEAASAMTISLNWQQRIAEERG